MNQLGEWWNRDLTPDELVIENENVTVFDGSNENPVMNMLKYTSDKYEGDEMIYIEKSGEEIVSSFRHLLVAHISSGFGIWVVLSPLVKETSELEVIKTARGLISLSFR